jgi:UDP-glucose 4-epimerase
MNSKNILVTGGCGYIGSHTVVELLNNNYQVTILDNLSKSRIETLENISRITDKDFKFVKGDLRNYSFINETMQTDKFEAVIHFAALKSVNESENNPIEYYENNFSGTLNLLKAMQENKIFNIIFSSSATVYGECVNAPVKENYLLDPKSVYGRTKLYCEKAIIDLSESNPAFKYAILRYFNPVGAHVSGIISEDLNQSATNLFPIILQTALGQREMVEVYGNDYPTEDGSGKRDYIHIDDLARGHLLAAQHLLKNKSESLILNLGTGKSHSVLEVIKTFEAVNDIKVPYRIVNRRVGDTAFSCADVSKANRELNWVSSKTLEDMCKDAWHAANFAH